MAEKEKRKEKPKRSNRPFVWLSVLMVLVFLGGMVWILSILLRPSETCCDSFLSSSEMTEIHLTNQRSLTQIAASATAAIANATATEAAKRE